MKLLVLLLLSLSLYSYAQDSYHSVEQFKCDANQACLKTQSSEYGIIALEDIDGYLLEIINSPSSLLDIDLTNSCYVGSATEVGKIINFLAGNTEADFYNGGHSRIESLGIEIGEINIKVNISHISDYSLNHINKISYLLPRCN